MIKQRFAGTVITVLGGCFDARIVDMTNPDNDDEVMSIGIDNVHKEYRDLVYPGASFDWVFYEISGFIIGRIYFKETQRWTDAELDRIKKEAGRLAAIINMGDEEE